MPAKTINLVGEDSKTIAMALVYCIKRTTDIPLRSRCRQLLEKLYGKVLVKEVLQ